MSGGTKESVLGSKNKVKENSKNLAPKYEKNINERIRIIEEQFK